MPSSHPAQDSSEPKPFGTVGRMIGLAVIIAIGAIAALPEIFTRL